ncbi:hypothetical protein PILCRDRAFT_44277, partial [Piloderma croceum F 1598]
MVNRRISPDMKYCALDLWHRGWTVDDICDTLSVSRASLYRWDAIFEEHGHVIRPPSPLVGRTRIITRAVLTAIHTLYEQEPNLYLDELCTFLAVQHNLIVSKATLTHSLTAASLTHKILHKIAIERDEELRNDWKDLLRDRTKYSLVAAITTEGYMATQVVPGSLDSFKFYNFIAEDVLPQMNPYPAERSVLVLDNCRIHHNDAIVELVH